MSTVFDLDDAESKRLDDIARANPVDLSQHSPGFWDGAATATGTGFLSGAAKTGNVGLRAIDAYRQGFSQFAQASGVDPNKQTGIPAVDAVTSAINYQGITDIGRSSVDYWAPDAATTGTAGQVLHGLAELPVPAIVGGVGGIGIVQGADTQQRLTNEGVDPSTALAVGATEGLANVAGLKVGAFGTNLIQRIATSVAGNTALNATATAAQAAELSSAGYQKQAGTYNPLDPTARSVDVLSGLFGGVMHHWASGAPGAGPQVDPATRDAVLTAKNASNFIDDSAPGVAKDVSASTEHQAAMDTAINQVNDTGIVDVDGMVDPEKYVPRGEGLKDGVAVDYPAFRRQLESGGNPTAANPLSSALGADQFTEGTWLNTVKQEKPAWAEGLSREQILAQRTNPEHSGDMATSLDRNNAAALTSAGLDATPDNLYAAHHFGEKAGVEFAKAADETPVADILSPAAIRANPYLKGKTKGEVVANWYERAGVDRDESSVVSGAPKFDTGAAIDKALADVPMPDGVDVPRSTSSEAALPPDPSSLDAAVRSDFTDEVAPLPTEFAPRDTYLLHDNAPEPAPGFTRLYRGEHADHDRGVFVTDDVNDGKVGGWFSTDKSYAESYKNTQEQGRRGPNKDGRIVYVDVPTSRLADFEVGRSALGQDVIRQGEGSHFIPSLRGDNVIKPRVSNRPVARASERPVETKPGATPKPAPPATPVDVANDYAARNPDAQVVIGFDGDGNPSYVRMADVMDAITAERDRAITDTEAFTAAAACALSRGLA